MRIYEAIGKSAYDRFFSFIVTFLCLPLFVVVSFLIKLDSKGPIFFQQKRVGKNGKLFSLLKFRTMYSNSVKEESSFEPGSYDRITRLGRILRKTKIDEFPQLINVLKGDMSFVGPRPEVLKYKSFYSGKHKKALRVKPGITDKASVKYRNEEELLSQSEQPEKLYREVILPDKLKINLEYVKKRLSFKSDMIIILKTLKQTFFT